MHSKLPQLVIVVETPGKELVIPEFALRVHHQRSVAVRDSILVAFLLFCFHRGLDSDLGLVDQLERIFGAFSYQFLFVLSGRDHLLLLGIMFDGALTFGLVLGVGGSLFWLGHSILLLVDLTGVHAHFALKLGHFDKLRI